MSTSSSFKEIFNQFNQLKVLIIGDVMIDSYLWGSTNRISPEAPVPIVDVRSREQRLGGAANVAKNIQALGAQPILCAIIGDDADGKHLLSIMKSEEITTEGIIPSETRITTIKHRIIAAGYHMLRVDQETTKPITPFEENALLDKINQLIDKIDVIIFEDYDKGVITETLIKKVVATANKKNIPTVVDPKRRNFLNYHQVSLFKPNRKELIEGLKLDSDLKNIKDVEEACNTLQSIMPVQNTFITLSEAGVYITDNKNNKHHIPAHLREIADVSGAGDTVISTAALCMALNLPIKQVAEISNIAGGLVCEQIGVVPIQKEKLLDEVQKLLC